MAGVDLDHPPEGVVILPDRAADASHLDPRGWVRAVRRPTPSQLRRRVAEHLSEARELGEV